MRRPWNITDTPVYSLATYSEKGVNMNICTYVMPVSRQPRLYAVGIENGTCTEKNLTNNPECVIQLLHKDQIELVKYLGYRSGFNSDKQKYLEKNELLTDWSNNLVLAGSAAYLMGSVDQQIETGDHTLFIFRIIKSRTNRDFGILMFQDLISEKIILS